MILDAKKFLFIAFVLLSQIAHSQDRSALSQFDSFMDGVWITQGKWTNGNSFHQEVQFSWGLNQKIVKVKTFGSIDAKSNQFGLRNEGIRAYNAQDSLIHFWEFDIFGGITQGVCYFQNQNLHYEYDYHGQKLRESWIYVDPNTYQYRIMSVKNGQADQIYMESTYRRIQKEREP